MKRKSEAAGVIIVGHGSRRSEANQRFLALVQRLAFRVAPTPVTPAFYSLAQPNLDEAVANMARRNIRTITLIPFFLTSGQHITEGIPALLSRYAKEFPNLKFRMQTTLEEEPALEELLAGRLAAALCDAPA